MNWKLFILSIIISLNTLSVYSQTKGFNIFGDYDNDYYTSLAMIDNHRMALRYNSRDVSGINTNTHLLILEREEVKYEFSEFNSERWTTEVYVKGDSVLLCGKLYQNEVNNIQIQVFDTTLQEITNFIFPTPFSNIMSHMIAEFSETDFTIALTAYNESWGMDLGLYKFNYDFDLIESNSISYDGSRYVDDLEVLPNGNEYYLFGRNFSDKSWSQRLTLNNLLEIISIDTILLDPFSPVDCEFIDNEKYLLGACTKKQFQIEEEDFMVYLSDASQSLINHTQQNPLGCDRNHGAWHNNLALLPNEEFYHLGTTDYEILNFYPNHSSKICLYRYNYDLEVIWEKCYFGDAYYTASDIAATPDGGCYICGLRWEPNNPINEKDVFVLRVDEFGTITSSTDNSISCTNTKVYPNPADDQIFIESVYDIKSFKLFDVQGNLILLDFPNIQNPYFDVSTLKQGIYIYEIIDNNNNLERGKALIINN